MRGVTFLELLITIAIILIIAAGAAPVYTNLIARNNLNSTINGFRTTFRKAQSYAISGKNNDAVWGVCTFGNNIRLFSGSCATPGQKEEIGINGGVNISGFATVTFNLRGEPNNTLSFTVSNQAGSKTITINKTGNVETN